MPVASLTGQDTIVLAGRVLRDFADGDVAKLEYPNELAAVKTGKNGNSIFAFNTMGLQCEMTLRVIRGSEDDNFLNALLAQMRADFASFVVLDGQFVKRVGDGNGNITNDTYLVGGGVFTKNVAANSNVEGDTEQSISMYTLKFANADRSVF